MHFIVDYAKQKSQRLLNSRFHDVFMNNNQRRHTVIIDCLYIATWHVLLILVVHISVKGRKGSFEVF